MQWGSFEGTPVNEGGAECGGGTARDVTSPGPTVSRAPLRGEELFARSRLLRKREVSSRPPVSVLSALVPGPECV